MMETTFIVTALLATLISCLQLATCTATPLHYIYIDGASGNDTVECLFQNSSNVRCQTLMHAFKKDARRNYMTYVLFQGIHFLNTSVTPFQNLQSLQFVGNGSSYNDTVIQCTGKTGGLSFNFSVDVSVKHLSLTKCRQKTGIKHLKSNWYKDHAALFFNECTSVILTDIRVSHSPHATGLVILDTDGENLITDSLFDHNGPLGHGAHMHIGKDYSRESNVSYKFDRCSFEYNSVLHPTSKYPTGRHSCVPLIRKGHTYNYGGGMSLVLMSNKTRVSIEFSNSTFLENQAVCGGGLYLSIVYYSVRNNIQLNDCVFQGNECPYNSGANVTFGGGIRLEHLNTNSSLHQNNITMSNCIVERNTAFSGGGMSVCPLAQIERNTHLLNVEIIGTNFSENVGEVGAAIEVTLLALRVQSKPPSFILLDSTFTSNHVGKNTSYSEDKAEAYQKGIGAVYTNHVPIMFQNKVVFDQNSGSALAVAGTHIDFSSCNANFSRNHGIRGGAIALLGAASMVIDDNTAVVFDSNHASLYGGAVYNIYVEKENLIAYFNCFVRHGDPFNRMWKANFTFVNNHALISGSSIFSTSVLPCEVSKNSNILCSDGWSYSQHGTQVNCTEEIRTEVGNICLHERLVSTIPGKIHPLNLSIFDDFGNDVGNQTVFSTHAHSSANQSASVDPQYSYISNEELVLHGVSGSRFEVHLSTTGQRSWHVELDIELSKCPPGFIAKDSSCECNSNYTYSGVLDCHQNSLESFLLTGYWLGPLGNDSGEYTDYVLGFCPSGFCNGSNEWPRKKYQNITDGEHLDETICGGTKHYPHRTGVLCGKCIHKYGPAVNSDSFECVKYEGNVPRNAALYFATVYIPLLILFSLMIVFSVRLTTGPANAFIFYSQIISSNFNINADSHILKYFSNHPKAMEKAYRIPYGLFNLEFIENFFPPFCVSPHWSTLDVFLLDYSVAVTPLVMIFIVLICFKLRKCCIRVTPTPVTTTAKSCLARLKSGEYLIHAFATFILLSYTKLGLISAYIVSSKPTYNATGEKVHPTRVYYAGQYDMTDKFYLVHYFMPACIVLFIITIPPIFLLGWPVIWFEKCLIRLPRLWKFYPVGKIHILLDTFQGCYKDNRRFFAGLYFLFRLAINFTYILTYDWIRRFLAQQIAYFVFVVLIALFWPYKKDRWIFNYVDLLIFSNLALINSINFYIFYSLKNDAIPNDHNPASTAFFIQYILVFLPLVYMLSYTVWKILGEKTRRKIKKFFKRIYSRRSGELELSGELDGSINSSYSHQSSPQRSCRRRKPTFSEVTIDDSEEYENAQNPDETLFVRAERRNTYKAMSTSSDIEDGHTLSTGSSGQARKSLVSDSGISTHGYTASLQDSQLIPIVNVKSSPHTQKNYGTN